MRRAQTTIRRTLRTALAALALASGGVNWTGAEEQPAPPAAAPTADSAGAAAPDKPAQAAAEVDFAADIQPIFAARCVRCHGPEMRAGGLRLDQRELARHGGDSGRMVLGGPVDDNELVARVSSDDRSYRMPKNAPPLAPQEIELLRRWVAQGSPWPEPPRHEPSWREQWTSYFMSLVDRYEPEYRYAQPYTLAFLALMFALLVVMRCKAAYRDGRAWTQGRLARFCRFADGIRTREVLLVMLVAAAGLALAWSRGHVIKLRSKLRVADAKNAQQMSSWAGTVYGYPPKPVRSDHPKQVAGIYYRGNCERNSELFNGGNYLTATFRISLCDKAHTQLNVGDPLPAGGVYVRIEIERAPGTTDQLFSKELMSSVVLTQRFYEPPANELQEEPVRLETLEEGQRWVAYVPIGAPKEGGALAGVIYIYTGQVVNNMLSGTLHYGAEYALVYADGKLSADSDLWMDSFGNAAFEPPRPAHRLPYREWFDYRPLPVITGENSKDPKLLGVDQYIREGLIKPPPQQQPEQNAPSGDKDAARPDENAPPADKPPAAD